MTTIKRGTTPTITVQIFGVTPGSVDKIEFLFKNQQNEYAQEICYKVYPGDDVSYNSEKNCFQISLTDAETRRFIPRKTAYMDTRITLTGGAIPATEIASFNVNDTLFQGTGNDLG